jgi:hypothetical protein
MERTPIKNHFLFINIIFESAFLAFCLVYYYRIYQRCKPFKTPYPMSNTSSFPMQTSNQVLTYDCTASSSDSAILILKSASLIVKITVKEMLWQCRSKKDPPSTHTTQDNKQYRPTEEDQATIIETKPKLCRSYPRQLYQLLFVFDICLFTFLLFFSWLPTFNQFYPSTKHCPDFITTGWHCLSLKTSVDAHCDIEAYKWQKFSWAEEFLWLVVLTVNVYQSSKITYDSLQLKYTDQQLKIKFKGLIQKTKLLEAKLALPCTSILYTQSIAIFTILAQPCFKFPGGIYKLIKNFFTIAFTKVDTNGRVTKKFTDYTISLTQVEQQNFYGAIATLPIILISSLILATIMYVSRTKDEIKTLTANSGSYLRRHLTNIALATPFIATVLFGISSAIVNQHDECYLDNTWNSLRNLFNTKSEQIVTGSHQSCNLYSVSAVQGSAVLQTAILAEMLLAFPLAFFSIFTIADVLLKNCNWWRGSGLKKLSFFKNPAASGTAATPQLGQQPTA